MVEVEQKVLSEAYQGSPKGLVVILLAVAFVVFLVWWREMVKK